MVTVIVLHCLVAAANTLLLLTKVIYSLLLTTSPINILQRKSYISKLLTEQLKRDRKSQWQAGQGWPSMQSLL